jgi:IclR family KDG regulon transcriptional repressor
LDQTLLKGLLVLETLARSAGARGVTDLAAETGLGKSNVHRVLKTLQSAGFVRQPPGGARYQPTLKLWELGARLHEGLDLTREARPHVAELARATQETVHLSVLDGAEVVYVDKLDSPQPIRAYSELGGRAPAHCVATGKVLLAFSAAFPDLPQALERYTTRTIVDRAALLTALAEVRSKGYATNWGEWRERVRGLAAPIRDAQGAVVAAIGVSGPAERFTRSRMSDMSGGVVQAAAAISAALGGPAA